MLLLLVRVYFALSPSYLHPDENFQGPEVFAGMSFSQISQVVQIQRGHYGNAIAMPVCSHSSLTVSPSCGPIRLASRRFAMSKLTEYLGRTLSYPSKLPWEFTAENPIRSVFPLWPIYSLPMGLLKWFYGELEIGNPSPEVAYYFLRAVMFFLSFVLEDWAIYELVPLPRHRRAAVVLVASSYVTWTYQTHTFSNSLETLLVTWGLVLIRRIVGQKV